MNDQITIDLGALPWMPTEGSEISETYHYYDAPLIGVLVQGGAQFLFWCVEGQVERLGLWLYSRLDSKDVKALERVDSEELLQILEKVIQNKPVTVALSHEEQGIFHWVHFAHAPASHSDLIKQVGQSLEDQVKRLEEAEGELQALRA